MKLIPVDSSNLSKVGYDAGRRELEVHFRNGGAHRHVDVPPEKYAGLMSADSHGSYYAANIRNNFTGHKIGQRDTAPRDTGSAPINDEAGSIDEAIRRYTGQ